MPLVPLDEMVLAGQGVPTLSLDGMDLRGGSLASAALINVSCDGTNLSGVPMDAAILAGADLRGAIGVTLEQSSGPTRGTTGHASPSTSRPNSNGSTRRWISVA